MIDLQQRLESYFQRKYPRRAASVCNVSMMPGGWEHEMFAFDLQHANSESEHFVLRLYAGTDAATASAKEFHCMQTLRDADYPVPRLVALERDTRHIGAPFVVMERINGQTLWPLIPNSTKERQHELRTTYCQLFAQLHRMDWRLFDDFSTSVDFGYPYACIEDLLNEEREILRVHGLSGFLPNLTWLEARRADVPCQRPSIAHMDFHYQNILLDQTDRMVVIDWAASRITDPRMDLAWTLMLQQSHVNEEERDILFSEYQCQAQIDVDNIAWFEVLACLWRLQQFVTVLNGTSMRAAHPNARQSMRDSIWAAKAAYEMLLARTSLRIAEVDHLFS